MATNNGTAGLQSFRKCLSLQSQIADLSQQLCDLDPESAATFVRQLAARFSVTPEPVSIPKRDRGDQSGTSFGVVRSLFASRDNEPITKPEIARLTGLSDGTVHAVIYSNPDAFHATTNPAGGRFKLWRLTNKALEEAVAAK